MTKSKRWIPMEPQPEGDIRESFADADFPNIEYSLGYWMYEDAEFRDCDIEFHPPFAVGERIPVREEWRVVRCKVYHMGGLLITIDYRDGDIKKFNVVNSDMPSGNFWDELSKLTYEYVDVPDKDWQPVSTMPPFAVRKVETVVSVEAKQLEEGEPDGVGIESHTPEWGWLVTTKEEDNA